MRNPKATLVALVILASGWALAQSPGVAQPSRISATNPTVRQESSSAQQRIEAAGRQLQANPKKLQLYNDLAIAYVRRARETADAAYLKSAEQALNRGLALDPKDFQLQKTEVSILLSRHEFVQARTKAQLLNRRTPDDVMTYGYLAEAAFALGDYSEAEKSTQWMLNMLPNNVPGLLLAARLRSVYGDPDGALELLNLAYTETSPTEAEDLAWILNQIASVQLESGKTDLAAQTLARSIELVPDYPYALENLAHVKLAQHKPEDAVALLARARQASGSGPHILYELAESQSAAGQLGESRATFLEFQKLASAQVKQADNANRDLIFFYARDPQEASAALSLAQHEIETRHDVNTLDAYAWALYSNARFEDAQTEIAKAISTGIKDAKIFNHAGHIAKSLHQEADAAHDFELSLQADPVSQYASDSRSALGMPTNALNSKSAKAADTPAGQGTAPAPSDFSADRAGRTSPSAEADRDGATPVFSPVPAALLAPRPSDTDRVIRNAQRSVADHIKNAAGYTGLGAAYLQRARETGDVSDYERAQQSLTKSLDLVSSDFASGEALETLAEVCMGEHRFTDALTYSQRALSLGSGDLSAFALVGDANADMGEYDQASVAYARLTPAAVESSPRMKYVQDSRTSYLKFVAGDTAGAIRLMKSAVAAGLEAQLPSENLAWLYFELGEYEVQAGEFAAADASYLSALTIHPGDYRALASLGKLRGNQGRHAEAILLYQRAIAIVPMPIFISELGDLYRKDGDLANAKKQYQLVEYIGQLGHINQVLHNRDLALFYADHDIKLAEALQLARKEFEVRHDIYTWDALAWALYKNGMYADADKASRKALQFGTRDAVLLFHAGMISDKVGQRDQARSQLREALRINPHFHLTYADATQKALNHLDTQAASNASGATYAH